jgi:cation transport regulator ChaB
MPYGSISELPPAVKKLSAKKQRQFMHVWNSAYNKCQADGSDNCEESAFKQAWSVVNKSEENFIAKAIKYFSDKLADITADENTITENDVMEPIDKSLVYWYSGAGYSYAIAGTNILDLGSQPPELEYSVNVNSSPYAIVVRRTSTYGVDKTVAELVKDDDLIKVQAQALALIEDNKNDVRSVSVCKYTGKTFAGRPVYVTVGRYDYISKSEWDMDKIEKGIAASINGLPSTETDVEYEVKLIKGAIAEGLVYGIVYSPLQLDTHGDWTSLREIENAAHNFLPSALKAGDSGWSDVNHSQEVKDVEIVESYIAPVDFVINNESVVKGTWILVARVNNEELRASIDKGEITGFSLEGKAHKVDIDLNYALEQK